VGGQSLCDGPLPKSDKVFRRERGAWQPADSRPLRGGKESHHTYRSQVALSEDARVKTARNNPVAGPALPSAQTEQCRLHVLLDLTPRLRPGVFHALHTGFRLREVHI